MLELNQTNKWYEKYDTVYLECPIDGTPTPTKTWLFNSNLITNFTQHSQYLIDSDGSLRIVDFDANQRGLYSCNASNEFGFETFSYKLELACMYLITSHNPIYIPLSLMLTSQKRSNVYHRTSASYYKVTKTWNSESEVWIPRRKARTRGELAFQRPTTQHSEQRQVFGWIEQLTNT